MTSMSRTLLLAMLMVSTYAFGGPNPAPHINQPLFPSNISPGSAGFSLTVTGTNFVTSSVVNWNGSPKATTFVTSSRLTAIIPASDVAAAGTASVVVVNPGPGGGGGTSNVDFFTVNTSVSSVSLASANFDLGPASEAASTGDFNHDGNLDLAGADIVNNQILIVLGNGDGTFQPAVAYATGSEPISIATGDFNGDGKLDLVTANQNNCLAPGSISVLLGNGDGSFEPHADFAVGICTPSVTVGDFNGDGKVDVAVVNNVDGTVSVLLGKGDGTFQPRVDYRVGLFVSGITCGDFNRDGRLDLAVLSAPAGNTTVSILFGKGDGTFPKGRSIPVQHGAYSIATADLNRDGKLDLAMAINANPSGGAFVLVGNGDGSFGTGTFYVTGKNSIYLTVADLNNDGKPDLALTNANSNTLSILLNRGNGTFQPHVDYATGPNPAALAAGDFDGNGRLDLAVLIANQTLRLSLFSQ
jgi:hypothetical protein